MNCDDNERLRSCLVSAVRHRRHATIAFVVSSLLVSGDAAHANGRFPQAQQVVVQPGDSPHTTAVRATFGIVVSDDSRETFHFFCEEAFQYLDGQDPALLVSPGGALLAGLTDGLVIFPPDRCSAERVPDLQGQAVVDLANDTSGLRVVAALASSDPVSVARVARSDDGGRTWSIPSTGFPGERFETVEVAASNPSRVYASGYVIQTQRDELLRSDDGGATFEHTMAFVEGTAGWFVSGVDPQRPDVLYVRAELASTSADPDAAASRPSILLRSDDGGDHLVEIARTSGPMRGFAMSDDGRTLWIGGPRDGLLRSVDGGPFTHVADVSVECLRFDRGDLLVCESFAPGGVMLGHSMHGDAVESVVRFDEIQGPPTCPRGTIVNDICPSRFSRVHSVIAPGAPVDAGMDAAIAEPPTPPAACGCRVARHTADREPRIVWFAIALWMASRGRRRAHR
jgi:hypothetical protein